MIWFQWLLVHPVLHILSLANCCQQKSGGGRTGCCRARWTQRLLERPCTRPLLALKSCRHGRSLLWRRCGRNESIVRRLDSVFVLHTFNQAQSACDLSPLPWLPVFIVSYLNSPRLTTCCLVTTNNGSLRLTSTNLHSPPLITCYLQSSRFNSTHLDLQRFAMTHLDQPGFTATHHDSFRYHESPRLAMTHLVSTCVIKSRVYSEVKWCLCCEANI